MLPFSNHCRCNLRVGVVGLYILMGMIHITAAFHHSFVKPQQHVVHSPSHFLSPKRLDAPGGDSRRKRQQQLLFRRKIVLDGSGMGMDEIEAARLQYEAMIGPMLWGTSVATSSNSRSKQASTTSVPNGSKILTSSSLRRKQIEIELLQSLGENDDAIDELMSLWIHAECPQNKLGAQLIRTFEQHCSAGGHAEEKALRQIIQQSRMEWIEPMNRLAFLLYLQKQYKECQIWLNHVLQEKPWHFEAIQLQVLLLLTTSQMNQKSTKTSKIPSAALTWARKGLPPMHQTKRRQRWVQQAVQQAQFSLQQCIIETDRIRSTTTRATTTTTNNNNQVVDPRTSTTTTHQSNGIWQ
jgi:hypothetical protein